MKLSHLAVFTMSLFAATHVVADENAEPAKSMAAPTAPAAASTASTPELSKEDKLSYSVGFNVGKSLKQQDIKVNVDLLTKGIKESLSAQATTLLTADQVSQTLQEFQKERLAKQVEEFKKKTESNTKTGQDFLEQNKKKDGVKVLASGLQYKVLKSGAEDGKKPKASDTVTTHYKGTLLDGTEFDSSYKRGEPTSFPVEGVIAGWTEALQLMKPGDKWQLFVPPELGYGARGTPDGKIGPNQTLVFEVELISIADPKDAEKAEGKTEESEKTDKAKTDKAE
jgi:FKBP-type peptidyl-prolyl cis-trans isomerase FklB